MEKSVYLVLVNKTHQLPKDWEQKVRFVIDRDSQGDCAIIERTTSEQFKKLQAGLLDQGIKIYLNSVYRSERDQAALWDYFRSQYGEEYCRQKIALPGYSEHQTGLAIDACIELGTEYVDDSRLFGEVHKVMPEYGFILRYPKGKEDITGYDYEPWHLRYVGEEAAKAMTREGLTLEEYLSSP